jgi:hypothetical protein
LVQEARVLVMSPHLVAKAATLYLQPLHQQAAVAVVKLIFKMRELVALAAVEQELLF